MTDDDLMVPPSLAESKANPPHPWGPRWITRLRFPANAEEVEVLGAGHDANVQLTTGS
jgi:hypothetical protein